MRFIAFELTPGGMVHRQLDTFEAEPGEEWHRARDLWPHTRLSVVRAGTTEAVALDGQAIVSEWRAAGRVEGRG